MENIWFKCLVTIGLFKATKKTRKVLAKMIQPRVSSLKVLAKGKLLNDPASLYMRAKLLISCLGNIADYKTRAASISIFLVLEY
jgi:hypothetical protein